MRLKKLQMNWKSWLKLVAFLILTCSIFYFLKSSFWSVKKVECFLDGQPCPEEIFNQLNILSLGKNLIFFPKQNAILSIKQSNSHISIIEIKKRIPNRLLFNLQVRKAVVAVGIKLTLADQATASASLEDESISLSGDFYLIDNQGVVLDKTTDSQDLPLIILGSDPFLVKGDVFDDSVRKTVELFSGLRLRLLETLLIEISSLREAKIRLKDSVLVLFNLTKEIENQLDSLQLILSRSKIEGKQIKKIDLRFDKPVIGY